MSISNVHPISRDAWLTMHDKVIGASEMPALVGAEFSRETYFGVWARKTGRIEPIPTTPAMLRGIALEKTALDMLQTEHPEWLIDHNRIDAGGTFFIDDEHRMGATPDAFVYDPKRGQGIVEVKTVAPSIFADRWWQGDEIVVPEAPRLQAGIGAHLAQARWCAVVALRVGFEIELDVLDVPMLTGRRMAHLYETAREFW